jgi:hypothetical protein
MDLLVRGKVVKFAEDAEPTLRWPPWFPATGSDRQQEAGALSVLAQSGHISRETAVKSIAASFDIEDVPAELARIIADEAASDARASAQGAQVKAAETLPI